MIAGSFTARRAGLRNARTQYLNQEQWHRSQGNVSRADHAASKAQDVNAKLKELHREEILEDRAAWMAANPLYAHTYDWEDHPEGYEDVCACRTCRSYGE